MQLQNSFTVPVPVEQAWDTLLDVERIAGCLPGAQLVAAEGSTYRGRVKVKVGPIQLTYRGEATILEQDGAARRLVLDAAGKETRGAGGARARVVARLADADGGTEVQVTTDLDLSGRPAQFGRGVIAEVSSRLIDQFAANIATLIVTPAPVAAPAEVTEPAEAAVPAAPPSEPAGTALDVWTLLPTRVRVGLRVVLPATLLVALGWLLGRRR